MSALFLPALCAAVLTAGLFARIDVYGAFVRGAKAGMETLLQMAPCLCAVLTLTALLRETGLLAALTEALRPALEALRLPGEAAAVVLRRQRWGHCRRTRCRRPRRRRWRRSAM